MEDPIEYKIRSLLAHDAGHHHCSHGHSHDHHHHRHNHGGEEHQHSEVTATATTGRRTKLPEELAEEEDLKLFGFGGGGHHHHDHYLHHGAVSDAELSGLGLWIHAMGCSLLAGAMLGDVFLHQLPHAFGGEHSHSHDHNVDHSHTHNHSGHGHFQSHAHSLKDLSVGLSILGKEDMQRMPTWKYY